MFEDYVRNWSVNADISGKVNESINDWVMQTLNGRVDDLVMQTLNGNIKDVWTKWRVHESIPADINGRVHD